jgi:hypothetical protein
MNHPFLKTIVLAVGIAATAVQVVADTPARAGATPKHELGVGVLKGTGTPDLIILPRYAGNNDMPSTGYCGPWNGGNQSVRFYVRNVGSAQAPASDVYVFFGGNLIEMVAVPALGPGQQSSRSVAIPLAAWGPSQIHGSANFLIAADHNDEVPEDDVTNNYGQGSCLGPAG